MNNANWHTIEIQNVCVCKRKGKVGRQARNAFEVDDFKVVVQQPH